MWVRQSETFLCARKRPRVRDAHQQHEVLICNCLYFITNLVSQLERRLGLIFFSFSFCFLFFYFVFFAFMHWHRYNGGICGHIFAYFVFIVIHIKFIIITCWTFDSKCSEKKKKIHNGLYRGQFRVLQRQPTNPNPFMFDSMAPCPCPCVSVYVHREKFFTLSHFGFNPVVNISPSRIHMSRRTMVATAAQITTTHSIPRYRSGSLARTHRTCICIICTLWTSVCIFGDGDGDGGGSSSSSSISPRRMDIPLTYVERAVCSVCHTLAYVYLLIEF